MHLLITAHYNALAQNVVKRCFCEHTNGPPGRNGLICEEDGGFKRGPECTSQEWCVGVTNRVNATNRRDELCKKGK